MILLYQRFEPEGLTSYYRDDFNSSLWMDEGGKAVIAQPFQCAKIRGGGSFEASINWQAMTLDAFTTVVDQAASSFDPLDSRPFSMGMLLAPPKSISIAALAGSEVHPKIINAHRSAVDFVASVAARMLVTRQRGEETPLYGKVLRFTHPFSRAEDPQLHDHLEWIPEPSGGALHRYPWFYFQFSLRQIYHYALVAELTRLGYLIEIGDAEELQWELAGIDPMMMAHCSQRSQEVEELARASCQSSLGAAMRWAALSSSKGLPKLSGRTLGAARSDWRNQFELKDNDLEPGEGRTQSPLVLPNIRSLFRKSASANILTLQGRALALCLGQTQPPVQAMIKIQNALSREAMAGRLRANVVRFGTAYLHPEIYKDQQNLIREIQTGIGKGYPLSISGIEAGKLDENVNSVLKLRNRIRVVSSREGFPADLNVSYADPADKESKGTSCLSLKEWDTLSILERCRQHSTGDLIIAVTKPARHGDLLTAAMALSRVPGVGEPSLTQRIFTLQKGMGRTATKIRVEIRKGSLPQKPEDLFMELERQPPDRMAVGVVHPGYSEALRRQLNSAMAGRLILSRPMSEASKLINVDVVVPFSETPKIGMEVIVHKNHPRFHLGTRWSIVDILPDRGLVLTKKRVRKKFSWEELEELASHISVVERMPMRIVSGMRLQAQENFTKFKPEKLSIKKGEIVTASALEDDGSLVLRDGRKIPARFRAFCPAFLVRELPKVGEKPDLVLTTAPDSVFEWREWALSFRSKRLIVFTSKPEEVASEIGREVLRQKGQKALQTAYAFVTGDGEFVPNESRCQELLHEMSAPIHEVPEDLIPRIVVPIRNDVVDPEPPRITVVRDETDEPKPIKKQEEKEPTAPVEPKQPKKVPIRRKLKEQPGPTMDDP